jgi:hypothetical protein
MRLHNLRPGAQRIIPSSSLFRNNSNVDTDDDNEAEGNENIDSANSLDDSQKQLQSGWSDESIVHAELVEPAVHHHHRPNQDIEQADVQPMEIGQAELLDDEALRKIAESSTTNQSTRKRFSFSILGIICLIVCVTSIVAPVTIVLSQRGGPPTDEGQRRPQKQQQQPSRPLEKEISDFPYITQHVLLFESRLGCVTANQTNAATSLMSIRCGDTDRNNGKEFIHLETHSSYLDCQKHGNPYDAICDIKANVTNSTSVQNFFMVISCGTTVLTKNETRVTVETKNLTGVLCQETPLLRVSARQLCTSTQSVKPLIASSMTDAACEHGTPSYTSGNLTFCDAKVSSCQYENGVPCLSNVTVNVVKVNYNAEQCSPSTTYQPINETLVTQEINSIFPSVED